jgi:hypothetical protein
VNSELLLPAVLLLISAICLCRIGRKYLVALAVACVAAGMTYWISEVGIYVLDSALVGRIPYDALLLGIPVLIFTSVFGLMFAPPMILILERLKLIGTAWTIVVAAIISSAVQWWALGQTPVAHPFNALVGVVAGLVFLFVLRRHREM